MTIPVDAPLVNTYIGNGVTDTFDFTFKITAADELNVIVVGVAFLELDTDYTVTGVGVNGGGSITLTAGALADGAEIRIYDWVQPSQLVPFANQGSFRGYQHENAFDKVTRAVKRALGYATRSLTLAEDTPWYINRVLPDPIPGGYYRWDQDGVSMEISAIAGYTDIGTTAGTVAAGDDSRFDNIEPGEMGTPSAITGAEKWVAAQADGEAVDLTAEQVLGTPVHQKRGHGRIYRQDYCDFHKVTASFSGTNGGQCGAEPWLSRFSGTAAAVVTAKLLTLNGMILTTGTDTNGFAAIEHLQSPNLFNFGYSMETTFKGGFNTANLPTVENQTAQIGFVTIPTALATAGFYFEADENTANWQAVVRANAFNVTKKDTGVAYTQDFTKRWKVVFDASDLDALKFLFYINEVLVATTLSSERIVPALTSLYMAAQVRKSADTTAAGLFFSDHSYKIQTAELVGF